MPRLLVSTWNRNAWGSDTADRLLALRTALERVEDKVAAAGLDTLGPIKAIFVAPEYYFSTRYAGQSSAGKMPRSLDLSERDEVLDYLTQLSRAHRRILMVPGTIAWQRPLDVSKMHETLAFYQRRAAFTTLSGSEQDAEVLKHWFRRSGGETLYFVTRVLELQKLGTAKKFVRLRAEELDAIRTTEPDRYDMMRQRALMARQMGTGALGRLERPVKNYMRAMANAAYGFLNGAVEFRYRKQANFNEEIGDDQLIFVPGGRSGVRQVEGVRFGIEVCLDHAIGMLGRQVRPNRLMDVHMILSDFVTLKPDTLTALREGGWVVHASTAADQNGVWRKTSSGLVAAPSLGEDKVAGGPLTHWEMDLDVVDPFELAGSFMTRGMDPPTRRWPTAQGGRYRSTG